MPSRSEDRRLIEKEFLRLGFDTDNKWRISDRNKNFTLCRTYPRFLIMPATFDDDSLEAVSNFRYSGRLPAAVWRHSKNGTFILRCSQPKTGWYGYLRSSQDENLIQAYINTLNSPVDCNLSLDNLRLNNGDCLYKANTPATNNSERTDLNGFLSGILLRANLIPSFSTAPQSDCKLLIIDARSYIAAMANRTKDGGCECTEYYRSCDIRFMNLANIHGIRKSYSGLSAVCESYSEQSNNWMNFLESSGWLYHISGLINAALLVVNTLDVEEKSAMVHCSDGWDRTTQIVALAQVMLDPYYRTLEGFQVLVQREWLDFGHKFADRCGNSPCSDDLNERCPVFLQWLDCVQQLINQFPTSFEFNLYYLGKLHRHSYADVFGTFRYNCTYDRYYYKNEEISFSLWGYINSCLHKFKNPTYTENKDILRPSGATEQLCFWKEVYMQPILTRTPCLGLINNTASTLKPEERVLYDSLRMDEPPESVCK